MRQSGVVPVGVMPTRLLFVLHADGSETQVTKQPVAIRGAAISPDGSRVVYAAGIGLYAVGADGGPVGVLASARNGSLEDPTFSPDGTQIAYDDGTGDHSHSVWLVDADGSDAHEILSNSSTTGWVTSTASHGRPPAIGSRSGSRGAPTPSRPTALASRE
jgi:Tol biopolymer transport system component